MNNGSSSPWYTAVEKYVCALPPEHRRAFNAPASAEDCLLLLQQVQLRRRKFDRLASALEPLVVPLKRFEGSIDSLAQMAPLFVSPIWGPLRCVIGLVCDRLASLSSVTTLLGRLVEPLKRFEDYERLFESSTPSTHGHRMGVLRFNRILFTLGRPLHQERAAQELRLL